MKKVKSYLAELTIVIFGVLIALVISNFKDKSQARKFQKSSIETVNTEVEQNYLIITGLIENHNKFLDTINKYRNDDISLYDLIQMSGGLQGPTISNSGLEFYERNKFNLIDFEYMSMLIQMKSTSELIETKLDKLMDYVYPNLQSRSEESKMLVTLYIGNVINSEQQLISSYEQFMKVYIE